MNYQEWEQNVPADFTDDHVLGEKVTQHRLSLLTQIVRLLLTMIPHQRGQFLHEISIAYETNSNGDRKILDNLLNDVPF